MKGSIVSEEVVKFVKEQVTVDAKKFSAKRKKRHYDVGICLNAATSHISYEVIAFSFKSANFDEIDPYSRRTS